MSTNAEIKEGRGGQVFPLYYCIYKLRLGIGRDGVLYSVLYSVYNKVETE